MSKVLLVDDDIAEISSVKRVLLRAGHQPALATNGSDAAAAIAYERPDLVIVSSTCENGRALAFAQGLASDAATAGIPILVLGDANELPAGARAVPRPLDPEQLMGEVSGALGRPGGIELEPPDAPRAAPAPKPRAAPPAAKAQPGRSVPPLVQAADAAAAQARAAARPGAAKPAAAKPGTPPPAAAKPGASPRPAPAKARSLSEPLPAPASTAAPAPAAHGGGLADAAASRRAAAEALRARAEELRKAGPRRASAPAKPAAEKPAAPTTPTAPAAADPPAPKPARAARPTIAETLDLDEGMMEAALRLADAAEERDGPSADPAEAARQRAADDALRALEEEASSHAAEVARSRRAEPRDDEGVPAARARDEGLQDAIETARREAFEAARRELEEKARQEAAEAARLVAAEARERREAVANAEREAEELARARAAAEERAHAAEEQLRAMRAQLEDERRKAEERVATVMQRAAQEEEAADELRRRAEDEIRRREEESARARAAEEEKLRESIETARSEMEALRRRSEDEARRRAEAESALRRLEETQRQLAEREVQELARLPIGAAAAAERFTPPPFFAPFDGAGSDADQDAFDDAARRAFAPEADGALETPVDAADAPADDEPAPDRGTKPPPAPLRGGELAELPVPRLLAMAARARLGGRLDFQGEVARSIWFDEGRVVGAASADPSDRVEEVALRLGLITREQHRQVAQATAALPSRRAALLLVERGFLKQAELTALVRRRTEEVLFGVVGEERGRFRWTASEVPPEERASLERGALALAVEGVRRRWRGARVDALLGGPATLLAPVPGAPGPSELGLSPDERRAVALADGLRAVDEIVQASPLDALTTRQVLAALVVTGCLTVRVLHAGQALGHAAASIDLARVKEKLEQVRRADYFTVLGVGRLCTPHEVREAADRLAAEFEPRRFEGVSEEGLPGRLAEILQVIQDAREVLADDRLREEYLRGLGDAV